ncbi:RND family efflux transporter, MFP subunit [Filimonas lacunae]|uniref:RND family efflux transporter, MFP subunit n=1 Tax=Filimonas lacunae TaxID=477680 RepID=A0A173MD67_9BACT|nr:efflux RND transporter periplasmic adaptor subunit [Filimonas lacunae]BAV05534.1 Co/Zn/Cd efflux system membrane fusion protein [Filimonas lacunae]SIT20515.1 RND family efflux transporter, MFP subunit [Filimonas lacunae]
MKKTLITVSLLLLAILFIIFRLAGNKKELDSRKAQKDTTAVAIPVKIAAAITDTLTVNIEKTGNISAFKEAKVLAGKSGNITHMYFELGNHIAQGKLLAVTDNSATLIDIEKAAANKTKLAGDVQTYKELLEGKATTAQKVKDLEQQYSDAASQEATYRKQFDDANIKAPIGGIIQTKDVETGAYVNAGAQIATIVNTEKVKVQVNLSEMEVYKVKQGQQVQLTAAVYPQHTFTGIITFISPTADAAHNYLTEITLPNNTGSFALLPGTFVKVVFAGNSSRAALTIPREAITGSFSDASVFLIRNNRVTLRKIQTGEQLDEKIEVTGGLAAGDQVIISGQINLKEGALIRVSQ